MSVVDMCFGPTASFVSSALLVAVGAAAFQKTRKGREALLATVPFVFAVQQFDEGLLWLGLLRGTPPEELHALIVGFLLIALCIWPIWMSIGVFLLEPNGARRRWMLHFIMLGLIFSLYAVTVLLASPVSAKISRSCIQYRFDYGHVGTVLGIVYVLSVLGVNFLSTHRVILAVGISNGLLGALAGYLHHRAFVSIWCFFATSCSLLIYMFLRGRRVSVPAQQETACALKASAVS